MQRKRENEIYIELKILREKIQRIDKNFDNDSIWIKP